MFPVSYSTPDFIAALKDGGTVAIGMVALGTITAFAGNWLILRPLKKLIREQTAPLQPDANGGKSLPDVHHKLDAVLKDNREVRAALAEREEKVDQQFTKLRDMVRESNAERSAILRAALRDRMVVAQAAGIVLPDPEWMRYIEEKP